MGRVDLQVPYSEKDEAKALGAKWDAQRRIWFVPAGTDAAPLKKWFVMAHEVNIRARSYSIIQSESTCWKCDENTPVYSFFLSSGHEVLEPGEDMDDTGTCPDYWVTMDSPSVVHYVEFISDTVADRIAAVTRNYYRDFSKTTSSSYWMNHCALCGMKQGDFMMHCEPDGAFFPMSPGAAARMSLRKIVEPFEALASFTIGVEFIEHMRKR